MQINQLTEINGNFAFPWEALIFAGFGTLIGSSLTLIATYLSHRWHVAAENEKHSRMINAFLQAIHDELETLWNLYMKNVGYQLETLEKNKPFNVFYPVTQDYFTVYTSNADLIGQIKDHELRTKIISTYSKARSLIDSYRMNNELVHKHEQVYWMFKQTDSKLHEAMAFGHYRALVEYAETLKKAHQDVKKQVDELLYILRKQGILSSS